MDYNPRLSMARGASQQQQQTRRQQEEIDPFILRDPDICDNVSFLGIPFTIDDLRKPQPQQIQRLYEELANLCMSVTRDTVAPAMSAAASDIVGADVADRLYSSDIRDLMGLFVRLRQFMVVCQVNDFGFADLFRPTYPRLQKILSYVINFVRFREGQAPTVSEFVEEKERLAVRVQQLVGGNEKLAENLVRLQERRKETERLNKSKEEELENARRRLLELDRQKNKTMHDGQRATDELKRLGMLFDEKEALLQSTSSEASKLRPYTFQKPDALETNLRDLNSTLQAEKSQIETLERRTRALQTSSDSFTIASQDVTACVRVLNDLSAEYAKEEEQLAKAARFREALSEKTNNVQGVEREEKLLQKRLDTIYAKTKKLRSGAEEKSVQAKVRMEELKEEHAIMVKERTERSKEVDRKRIKIEQTEKKVSRLIIAWSRWM